MNIGVKWVNHRSSSFNVHNPETVQLPASSASRVQIPASRSQRPDSSIQSPASRFQGPESRVQRPESSVQSPASRVQRPASRVQRPESSVQSPASRVQRPESRVQRPTFASRVQELCPFIASIKTTLTLVEIIKGRQFCDFATKDFFLKQKSLL